MWARASLLLLLIERRSSFPGCVRSQKLSQSGTNLKNKASQGEATGCDRIEADFDCKHCKAAPKSLALAHFHEKPIFKHHYPSIIQPAKMESKHILKIPFETSNNSKTPDLLLCVTSPSKTSTTSTLPDLTIQATEGQSPFIGHLYSSRLSKILSQDANLSIEEFEVVLAHILLQQPLPASHNKLQDVSAIAVWLGDEGSKRSSIRLRFKREIGDIRHYLGEIVLKADADVELDVLDWTRVAVMKGVSAEREMAGLRSRLVEAEKGVQLIRAQLDELLQVKTRDEEVLMGKFVQVLNEKKARIRELEIDLGRGGRPWPEVDEEVNEEREGSVMDERGSKSRKGKQAAAVRSLGASGTRKRKQAEPQTDPALGDLQNGPDEEDQQDRDMETDRESVAEGSPVHFATDDEDVKMSIELDNLDAPPRSQMAEDKAKRNQSKPSQTGNTAKGANNISGSKKQETSSKQHALRTRKLSPPPSEDDGTTDDEL